MQDSVKNDLLKHCYNFVQDKQDRLQNAIADSQSSLESESQSTAGDKHDTGRAMMHLEIEKKSQQLKVIQNLKKILGQINPNSQHSSVGIGTIVETNQGSFFMAINAGKITIHQKEYLIISLASPLGQALMKAKKNIPFTMMNREYKILSVF